MFSITLNILQDSQIQSLIISIITLFLTILGGKKVRAAYLEKKAQKLYQVNPQAGIKELIRSQVSNENLAAIIYGQFYHETGGGTSDLYHRNHNLFGMKNPVRRSTTSVGGDSYNYAIYKNKADSVRDLVEWLKFNNLPLNYSSAESYVSDIKAKGYFTDNPDNYLKGVKYGMGKYFAI